MLQSKDKFIMGITMSKKCKKCKYKKQYILYCKEQKIQDNIEKSKNEILSELKEINIDYSQLPSDNVINYCKDIKGKLEAKDNMYKKLLYVMHIISLVFCIAMIIFAVKYSISQSKYGNLVVLLPFVCFVLAEIISISNLKEKSEQDAYNSIMAMIAFVSLLLAIIGLFKK